MFSILQNGKKVAEHFAKQNVSSKMVSATCKMQAEGGIVRSANHELNILLCFLCYLLFQVTQKTKHKKTPL